MVGLHQKLPSVTVTKINEGKPKLDIAISGGMSFKSGRSKPENIYCLFVIFFIVFFSTMYVFSVHKLFSFERSSTELEFRLQKLDETRDRLLSQFEAIHRQSVERIELCAECLKHHRQRRSINQNNNDCSKLRRRNRCNRTKTMETVAVQFRGSNPDGYDNRPMEGVLGPWFEGPEFGKNMESFGVALRDGDRKLEIFKKGLYFIYSQVTYLSKGTLNSYSINIISTSNTMGKINNAAALCSTVGTDENEAEISCYTSTIRILNPSDVVYLQQNQRNRTILFENNMTYFGLILLNEL